MNDDELYAELVRVDADFARQIHRHNRFRVQRAIDIFYRTGRPKSDWLRMQAGELGGALRFANALIVYLDADAATLNRYFVNVFRIYMW